MPAKQAPSVDVLYDVCEKTAKAYQKELWDLGERITRSLNLRFAKARISQWQETDAGHVVSDAYSLAMRCVQTLALDAVEMGMLSVMSPLPRHKKKAKRKYLKPTGSKGG